MPVVNFTRDGQAYSITLQDSDLTDGRPNASGDAKINAAIAGQSVPTLENRSPVGVGTLLGDIASQFSAGLGEGAESLGTILNLGVVTPEGGGVPRGTQAATQEVRRNLKGAPEPHPNPWIRFPFRNLPAEAVPTALFMGSAPTRASTAMGRVLQGPGVSATGAAGARTLAEEAEMSPIGTMAATMVGGNVGDVITMGGRVFAPRSQQFLSEGAADQMARTTGEANLIDEGTGGFIRRGGTMQGARATDEQVANIISDQLTDYVHGPRQAIVTRAYNTLDEMVPPSTQIVPQRMLKSWRELNASRSTIHPDLQNAYSRIKRLIEEGPITLQKVRAIRGILGRKIGSKVMDDYPELKSMYAEISQDMVDRVGEVGGARAQSAFRTADRLNTEQMLYKKNIISKVANTRFSNTKKFREATRRDVERLEGVFEGLDPQAKDLTVMTVIENMGRKSDADPFDVGKFVTAYREMPEGIRRTLFANSSNKQLRTAIEEIAEMQDVLKQISFGGEENVLKRFIPGPFVYNQLLESSMARRQLQSRIRDVVATSIARSGAQALPVDRDEARRELMGQSPVFSLFR